MKRLFLSTLILTIVLFFSVSFNSSSVLAQNENLTDSSSTSGNFEATFSEETLEGEVVGIIEEKELIFPNETNSQLYQKLKILVTKGSLKDKEIIVENGNLPSVNIPKYKSGDNLVIYYSKDFEGFDTFYIADYVRRSPLLWLFLIFVVLAIAVGRWQGITSLIGMGISFVVIFKLILPQIYSGADPVQTAILGSLIIIPVTFFLSHGVNKKTTVAMVGTLIALMVTGVLADTFVNLTRLTGFSSEEAGFLQSFRPDLINIKGLLLAGIIIGVLGVLDDITISQAAIVQQLKIVNTKLNPGDLYKKAMTVGRDHIASMVNTLILVYTGASLPLLLLFIDNPHTFSEIINYEIVAEEIVRTLVGSIGLIMAVPITTFIAVLTFKPEAKKKLK